MSDEFTYRITTTRFDEDYSPAQDSRATTNFANLARGEHRRQNLRNTLSMINDRFNDHRQGVAEDRKSTRLNSSHVSISYAVFCLKKKKKINYLQQENDNEVQMYKKDEATE